MHSGQRGSLHGGSGVAVLRVGQRPQRRGVPVWLHDVDPLTIAHPMGAADDVRQVYRVIGQRGECGLQPGALGRIRRVVVDWFVDGRRDFGDGVHV